MLTVPAPPAWRVLVASARTVLPPDWVYVPEEVSELAEPPGPTVTDPELVKGLTARVRLSTVNEPLLEAKLTSALLPEVSLIAAEPPFNVRFAALLTIAAFGNSSTPGLVMLYVPLVRVLAPS